MTSEQITKDEYDKRVEGARFYHQGAKVFGQSKTMAVKNHIVIAECHKGMNPKNYRYFKTDRKF